MSQLLDYTKKMTKNREKIRKILLGQNCLRSYGYDATGMYFKALHYLCADFLDKSLDPYERVYKAWWCKTFLLFGTHTKAVLRSL